MKKIYTSNYARQGHNELSIGISASMPKWYAGQTNSLVAPTWDLVRRYRKKDINRKQYTKEYFALLEERKFDAQEFVDKLPDGTMLLCYESPGDFCHRRLLAKWINAFADYDVSEWRNEKEQNRFEQMNFVEEMVKF